MRKLAANLVFTLAGKPLKNGVVTIDEEGKVVGVTDTGGKMEESESLEFYNGIIVPGFINCHCHLEFSYMKGQVPQHTGIGGFIAEINRKRAAPEDLILREARKADQDMFKKGISAVGDITNTSLTLEIKKESPISYFTFVETFGFHPSRAQKAIGQALEIRNCFKETELPASIVPHAPYSVSDDLFREITALPLSDCNRLSMHNQESLAEEQFFLQGDGPILDHMEKNLGQDVSHWQPTGKSPLASVLSKLPANRPLLLVHNTFITHEDLELLKSTRHGEETYMVLCPNSNLFIENKLPRVEQLRKAGMNICLGTDSLASNTGLSILEEMITLQNHFPGLPLEELLNWACLAGATALGMDDRLGSIEPGKTPGLVLITGLDLNTLQLKKDTVSKRLA